MDPGGFFMVLDRLLFFMVPGRSFMVPVGFHGPRTIYSLFQVGFS